MVSSRTPKRGSSTLEADRMVPPMTRNLVSESTCQTHMVARRSSDRCLAGELSALCGDGQRSLAAVNALMYTTLLPGAPHDE